jgi:hypothetical protein
MIFADDVQYYDFYQPQQTALLADRREATSLLMGTNRLQFNAALTVACRKKTTTLINNAYEYRKNRNRDRNPI